MENGSKNENCVGSQKGYESNDANATAGLRIYTSFQCERYVPEVESTLSN